MKRILFLAVAAILALSIAPAGAVIYMDEDFEGASALADQNFPIQGSDAENPPTVASVAIQGINIRAYNSGDYDYTTPKIALATNAGAQTAARHFLGAKGYMLASGQSLSNVSGQLSDAAGGPIKFTQFAISATDASLALPASTVIGRYKSDWTTVQTTGPPEASLELILRTNGAGGAELVCANTNAVLGALSGGTGNWLLVSLIFNVRVPNPDVWAAYDPLTQTYKGPQPTNPLIPPVESVPTDLPSIPNGVSIYVNSDAPVAQLTPDQIGPGWGSDADVTAPDPNLLNSVELGFTFAAENGGTIILDNLYWDSSFHDSLTTALDNEQAARMLDFETPTTETGAPPDASAINWQMY